MPQMSPMNWLLLSLYFILIMITIIMFIYFIYWLKSKKLTNEKSMMYLYWMW